MTSIRQHKNIDAKDMEQKRTVSRYAYTHTDAQTDRHTHTETHRQTDTHTHRDAHIQKVVLVLFLIQVLLFFKQKPTIYIYDTCTSTGTHTYSHSRMHASVQ